MGRDSLSREQLLARAKRCRQMAENTHDPAERMELQTLAKDYEAQANIGLRRPWHSPADD